ncbi:MAG: MFS transporter [Tetragenococcus koreensis]|uniref:MFS transporter n=1 Tax=Tetragenococcus halophilus TaxID=51669 RepID=UPI00209AADAD|nr:MFS transporter [Tetragenococcus halophilus]MDN6140442.1 MFS transporter [Tetragenococcus koreensis]MDN6641086.1 MFS transporter [Tetragenococcus sp.]MCO8290499.1 MFS transporter [Tetragenococcus halophilus]MCO8294955.1 MFS transporter [Tetragenococcus halophilus]MDN6267941.1 MFS transporter [Tetragenococcus koreensis]
MEDKFVSKQTKLAIASVALLSFLGILVETSLNVTFPTLTQEFHVSLGTMQWATSGYLLMVTIIMSTTGHLIKKYNAQLLFRIAAIFCMTGTVLCSVAFTFPVLMVGRLLQAVSTGLATPLMFHIILSLIPQSQLGLYMGLGSMVTSFAPALGPTYGGLFTSLLSWRAIFIATLPIVLVIVWSGGKNIQIEASGTKQRFDWKGVILLSWTFFSLSIAFSNAGNNGFYSLSFFALLALFIVGVLALFLHFHFSEKRILNFALLLRPIIGLRWINFFILQFINIGISFVLPIFAQNYLGTDPFIAGLILFPGSLLGAAIAPYAGRLYDRYGPLLPLSIANTAMLLGCLLFYFTTPILSVGLMILLYIFLRVGFNFGFGNTLSDASKQVTPEEKADINSLFNTFQQYAGSFGTSVLSAVISSIQLRNNATSAVLTARGSQIDFSILAILAGIGLITIVLAHYLKRMPVQTNH